MSASHDRSPATDSDILYRVRRTIREQVRAMQAYPVTQAKGMIKLDAMENPYSWPVELLDSWLETLRSVELNRYPDARADALVEQMRATLDLPAAASILLGNGSDELIQMCALATAGRPVLAPSPSFVMYETIAGFAGSPFGSVPLGPDFSLDTDAMLATIRAQQPALVFIAYPNNPTGNLFDRAAVEQVLAASPGLVVIDEAYHPFAQTTWMDEVLEYPDLVVMRTVSKLGFAGLRLGYLVGDPAWLTEFDKVRLPYNINALTQASALFALQHDAVFAQQAADIRAERGRLFEAMNRIPGIEVFPSAANFLLFRAERPAEQIFDALYRNKILIKNLNRPGTVLANCLRVTVGTAAENDAFLAALSATLD